MYKSVDFMVISTGSIAISKRVSSGLAKNKNQVNTNQIGFIVFQAAVLQLQ